MRWHELKESKHIEDFEKVISQLERKLSQTEEGTDLHKKTQKQLEFARKWYNKSSVIKIVRNPNAPDSSVVSGIGMKFDSIRQLSKAFSHIPDSNDKKSLSLSMDHLVNAVETFFEFETTSCKLALMPSVGSYGIMIEIRLEATNENNELDITYTTDSIWNKNVLVVDDDVYTISSAFYESILRKYAEPDEDEERF